MSPPRLLRVTTLDTAGPSLPHAPSYVRMSDNEDDDESDDEDDRHGESNDHDDGDGESSDSGEEAVVGARRRLRYGGAAKASNAKRLKRFIDDSGGELDLRNRDFGEAMNESLEAHERAQLDGQSSGESQQGVYGTNGDDSEDDEKTAPFKARVQELNQQPIRGKFVCMDPCLLQKTNLNEHITCELT